MNRAALAFLKKQVRPLLEDFRAELVKQRKEGATDIELIAITDLAVKKALATLSDNAICAWLIREFSEALAAAGKLPPGKRDRAKMN